MSPVAQEIARQMGGASRINIMTGGRFSFGPDTLHIRLPKQKVFAVRLTEDDTYTVTLHVVKPVRLRADGSLSGGVQLVKEESGVYCDMLVPLFEEWTGLYLSLGAKKAA